jgi:hypothetical protein
VNITEVLLKMGYLGFAVRGDTYEGIEWIVEPTGIPSKEQVLLKKIEFESLEQDKQDAKAAAKESALTKLQALGLTEEEVNAILGGI